MKSGPAPSEDSARQSPSGPTNAAKLSHLSQGFIQMFERLIQEGNQEELADQLFEAECDEQVSKEVDLAWYSSVAEKMGSD